MAISVKDRWRLLLGRQPEALSAEARPFATALEELYGAGRGEGSQQRIGPGAGQGPSTPSTRAWLDEIGELFGDRVREEVLGRAIERGRNAALLDEGLESVTPSVHLLEQILRLQGALPESHIARVRRTIRRIVEALTAELATRVRPALQGANTARATRRNRGGALDLQRTVSRNLDSLVQVGDDARLVPRNIYFKERGRKSMDWEVSIIVDVSGSMDPSIIYSAMMAAILSGVPWLRVRFYTFSTEVIDLTERAEDPLGLLLEISVGGGTHIAKALRYAREQISRPQRNMLLLLTDFEEGYPIGGLLSEVRALVESGVKALGLAALSDEGAPRYNVPVAERVAAAGMPVAALSPSEVAAWIGEQVRD